MGTGLQRSLRHPGRPWKARTSPAACDPAARMVPGWASAPPANAFIRSPLTFRPIRGRVHPIPDHAHPIPIGTHPIRGHIHPNPRSRASHPRTRCIRPGVECMRNRIVHVPKWDWFARLETACRKSAHPSRPSQRFVSLRLGLSESIAGHDTFPFARATGTTGSTESLSSTQP